MRLTHPAHPGRAVRLAYCMNLHAGETPAELFAGLRAITLPLRDRLAPRGAFGVGLYLSGALAAHLASDAGAAEREALRATLAAERLAPFTYNAFPFGGFHAAGLKRAVFEPTWLEPARARYTLDVARLATELADEPRVTISTHTGRFGAFAPGELDAAAAQWGAVLAEFAELRERGGPLVVLALEAEPRSAAGTTSAARALDEALRARLRPRLGHALLDAHLALCLDTCHAAVEFEEPAQSLADARAAGIGKVQVSSALRLPRPGEHAAGRAALCALDEPRYLHQTTGRRGAELLRVDDLPELAARADDAAWLACDEWRTHFHVPIDLARLGDDGLATTRDHTDALVSALVAEPARWGADELQLELETYTWDVLPGAARGAGELVDGLEREYRHALALLGAAGWRVADEASKNPSAER
ncbi:MAG: metabolite traffic protein EboE [Planctomycetes bacterium]|nr:metabolite traffic protein EboE [Planctomycetota bacterium]